MVHDPRRAFLVGSGVVWHGACAGRLFACLPACLPVCQLARLRACLLGGCTCFTAQRSYSCSLLCWAECTLKPTCRFIQLSSGCDCMYVHVGIQCYAVFTPYTCLLVCARRQSLMQLVLGFRCCVFVAGDCGYSPSSAAIAAVGSTHRLRGGTSPSTKTSATTECTCRSTCLG